jgi:hypothetical protein
MTGALTRGPRPRITKLVPAELFPAMAHVAPELDAALGSDDAFELGLKILLDGVERHAAASSAHLTGPPPGGGQRA